MNRFYNTLAALAVLLSPAAMMALLGWEAYSEVLATTGHAWLAVLSGIAVAGVLECVGIVAGETALHFHALGDRRWFMPAAVLLLYVATGIYILRGTSLVLLPLLAGAVYLLVGLRAQASRELEHDAVEAARQVERDDEAAREAAEWQREQWRIRQADKTRVKLAQSQQAPLAPPASSLQAGSNGASSHTGTAAYICKHCKESFATMQALGAHVRHNHKEAA